MEESGVAASGWEFCGVVRGGALLAASAVVRSFKRVAVIRRPPANEYYRPLADTAPLSKVMPLHFVSATNVAPLSPSELDEMRRMIRNDHPHFDFDPEYLNVLKECNGGVPETKFFRAGIGYLPPPIERFLNCADASKIPERHLVFLSANVFWSALDDRLGTLLPFAVLADNDALCFDCSSDSSSVVLWSNENSSENSPSIREVSPSFSEFCASLSSTPFR